MVGRIPSRVVESVGSFGGGPVCVEHVQEVVEVVFLMRHLQSMYSGH